MSSGKIVKISGPLITAQGIHDANMFDVVSVSRENLIGEIIEMRGDRASIQVYEETSGLKIGESVVSTYEPMSVELGPGLIGEIFDGIQRPLKDIKSLCGNALKRGVHPKSLDRNKKWWFTSCVKVGESVEEGDIIGEVRETACVIHKIIVPMGVFGKVTDIKSGEFCITDTVCTVETEKGEKNLTLMQKWQVRKGRRYKKKLPPDEPLITGQRVIDFLFPIAKGGVAAIPGPFGSGKTVTQHQLAKWAQTDIVVYIGCGERGNEMTDVLNELPNLKDPRTGYSLAQRTVLIANTSDMPVAAREASIYTGVTIAEYFRDMGYSVALMADSTSRWAQALREMSGRLEEMPGEEGYPAYLASRLAQFYERAGRVLSLGKAPREGALTIIGAVSPPGGDISEPVSQATLRIVKVFWHLDSALAYKRHFPAVNWLTSYSLYTDSLKKWYKENVSEEWELFRSKTVRFLHDEAQLDEIVKLIGTDAVSPADRLKLETARSIREDFLHQLAFHSVDTYTSLKKQLYIIKLIFEFHKVAEKAVKKGVSVKRLTDLPVREKIGRFKYLEESECLDGYSQILSEIESEITALTLEEENDAKGI